MGGSEVEEKKFCAINKQKVQNAKLSRWDTAGERIYIQEDERFDYKIESGKMCVCVCTY